MILSGARTVVQHVQPPFVEPAWPIRQFESGLLGSIQLAAYVPEKQQLMAQMLGCLLHMWEDPGGVPGSWFGPDPSRLLQSFGGVNESVDGRICVCATPSLPVSLPFK